MNELCIISKDELLLDTIVKDNDLSCLSIKERIEYIEKIMRQYPQLDIPVKHSFADGIYIREILIPKGTLLTSKYHKYEQLDFMLIGEMSIVTNEGVIRIKAPFFGKSQPGTKRLGYAHEDVLWLDIHSTKETDVDRLEEILYADTSEEIEQFILDKYHKDYEQFLLEYNISPELVRSQSESMEDQISISLDNYKLKIGDSNIEGKGLFAVDYILERSVIAPARVNGLRTQAGRYTNHSSVPNAVMLIDDNDDVYLIAKRNVYKEEITIDYRQSLAMLGIFPVKEISLCQE
jgi:hypothetical protein